MMQSQLFAWSKAVAVALGLAMLSGAAGAATVSADQTGPVSNGPVLAPTSTTGNFQDNINGNNLAPGCTPTVNCARTPFEGSGLENTASYSSVQGGGTATYVFGSILSTLEILWGSPDTYNHIDFYRNGGFLETVSGDDGSIVPPATLGIGFANVVIMIAGGFDEIVLRSVGQDAFEYANLSAVPLPAALPLLGLGLSLLGLLGWRRRQTAVA